MRLSFNKADANYTNVLDFLDYQLPKPPSKEPITLSLSYAELSGRELAEVLTKLSQYRIEELDLMHNALGDEGAKVVAQSINKYMKKIHLCHNDIGDLGAIALAEALGKHKKVEIDLSHNQIGDQGAKALTEATAKLSSRKTLDLSHNLISRDGAQHIVNRLQQNRGAIRDVFLQNNSSDITEVAPPKNIRMTYKVKELSFPEAHPYMTMYLMVVCPILFCIWSWPKSAKS